MSELLYMEQLQKKRKELSDLIEKIVTFYTSISCPCAFPRFHQFVGLNCVEFQATFFCHETEYFIRQVRPGFQIEDALIRNECTGQTWTCKTCGSKYQYAWSDFSIVMSRDYLKIIELKTAIVGSEAIYPIPYYLGLMGHSYPERKLFQEMSLQQFENYLKA